MAILLHLINNWQMNLHQKQTLLAVLLLSACIVAGTAGHCYADSYASAPTNGSASQETKDCLRVDRGGSWLYPAWLLRSATRERNAANYRDRIMGFRVAKRLP